MAKTTLATNFQDDIMNDSMGGKRRFNVIQNADGTISLEDVTTYDQVGSNFGAAQINATNNAVNESADANKIIDSSDTIKATTESGYIAGALGVKKIFDEVNNSLGGLKFGIDSDGNYGYIKDGADSVIPFSSIPKAGTVFTTSGVNLQEYFPYSWQNLRTSDFIAGIQSASASQGSGTIDTTNYINGGGASVSASCSYNNDTGVLTFSCNSGSWRITGGVGQRGPSGSISGNLVFAAWKGTYSGK